jgi:benzylsuccinate CoA-transferase BbsF subunit
VVRIREPRRDGAADAPDAVELGLDLAAAEGVALARRLADRADVVVAGAAPGLLAGLGLAREQVVLSCPAAAGGAPPPLADVLAPPYAAALLAAALLARRRTGRGRHLDVADLDDGVRALAALATRAGGEAAPPAAPRGVYPCDGGAIAIAVHDDEQWDALVGAMGDPAWALEPRFATGAARRAHGGALDARLAAWTAAFAPYELMAGLQAAGVPAGVVQDPAALLRDPQLAHRGHFVRVAHPALFVERSGFRLSAAPGGFEAAGAPAGALLRDAFGLSDAEVAGLRARGVLA